MNAWGVTGLTVDFGRRRALDDVTLAVGPGTTAIVAGGDGAGKTTLLRALAGVVRPAGGAVRRPPAARIGYVSGSTGVYTDLTVDENLAFAGEAYGLRDAALAARTAAVLAATGLEAARSRLAARLSGGMRQKLAVACATLHEPDLLILDEPTTGVDPVSRQDLWRLLQAIAAHGTALVLSTTYMDEARRGDTLLVLDDGRVLASGTPADVAVALPEVVSPATHVPRRVAADARRLIETAAVTRRFGAFTAVNAVDLHVRAGEVVGLLGANGAGKTTLIRLVLGLLRPSAGAVRLCSATPSRATRRRIGYVPQGLGLWDDLTVDENLAFSAASFGVHLAAGDPSPAADGAGPALLDADLASLRDSLVRDLPLGLRRRLAFAAALAHAPDILVLDEPTSGVDPRARARLWTTIGGAADGGAAVLVTTHYLEEAVYCDRLVVLAEGRVVASGSLDEIVGEGTLEAAIIRLTTARSAA